MQHPPKDEPQVAEARLKDFPKDPRTKITRKIESVSRFN